MICTSVRFPSIKIKSIKLIMCLNISLPFLWRQCTHRRQPLPVDYQHFFVILLKDWYVSYLPCFIRLALAIFSSDCLTSSGSEVLAPGADFPNFLRMGDCKCRFLAIPFLLCLYVGVVLMADRLEVTFLEVTLKLPCWPGVLSALLWGWAHCLVPSPLHKPGQSQEAWAASPTPSSTGLPRTHQLRPLLAFLCFLWSKFPIKQKKLKIMIMFLCQMQLAITVYH